jgi:hypothetical protein
LYHFAAAVVVHSLFLGVLTIDDDIDDPRKATMMSFWSSSEMNSSETNAETMMWPVEDNIWESVRGFARVRFCKNR